MRSVWACVCACGMCVCARACVLHVCVCARARARACVHALMTTDLACSLGGAALAQTLFLGLMALSLGRWIGALGRPDDA